MTPRVLVAFPPKRDSDPLSRASKRGNTGKWPAQPGDPNFGTLGAQVFYIDAASDPSFVGDSGIPAEAGHYSYHPAPGVAADLQVAFRPAK
jgi:hypothetical protein